MSRVAPELQASARSLSGAALRSEVSKRGARLNKSFVRAGARRMELYADEMKDIKKDNFLRSAFWEGDTNFDAFLTAAAAQVGQVLLTLPSSFAATGLAVGILFQLAFATAALWTLYMLAGLYQEFRKQRQLWRRDLHHGIIMVTLDDMNMTGRTDKVYCVQYHEIIYELCGPWLGTASWVVNVLALVGLAVAQVIACASNMHRLSSRFTKRDYALLFGSIGLLMTFIPSFRNMRIFSCIALLGTTFTAWYLVGYAGRQGYQTGLWGIPDNQSLQTFVEGGTNLLFVYGGHAMLVEVMDSMHQPHKFPKVFRGSYFYIFTLTLPSAATMYAALPTLSGQHGNIFDALPSSLTRSTSIVLMIAHQCFAYAMFIMPVHHMWEKAIGTHDKPYWIRLPSRIPVGTVVMLIALAFPFFGVINSFLGAGTTTLETYIIPAVAYNWVYRHEKAQTACASPPPWVRYRYGWKLTLMFNDILITCTFVFGMGFGMWASMLDLVKNTSEFGIFAACYNCAR